MPDHLGHPIPSISGTQYRSMHPCRGIPCHRAIDALLGRPRAFQTIHLRRDRDSSTDVGTAQNQQVELSIREVGRCGGIGAVVEEDFDDGAVDDAEQAERHGVQINQRGSAEFVGEEGIVVRERTRVPTVEEEGGVSAQVVPTLDVFACAG